MPPVSKLLRIKFIGSFAQYGLQGIEKDLPGGANHGGKNTAAQARLRSKIIKVTTQSKPKDGTHWSTRSLAKKLKINHSFVNRVWRETGLKTHLSNQFNMNDLFGYHLERVFPCLFQPPLLGLIKIPPT